ncbi:hypothetical protein HYH03_017244 [Edaphochlamys debaryana]|uniref:CS domain-containing protein n=1 Tax=Edaphochlamys debaryana TaxID=47281 RepID=A0A835XJG3_9CHLO|nr:hypothetical protein HYH03_017244 [Edaphochlamys debaryana]|eukprot:KAG2483923.1 hypothetical protein HYH03_017244 [Edaphochlamys debaryana]
MAPPLRDAAPEHPDRGLDGPAPSLVGAGSSEAAAHELLQLPQGRGPAQAWQTGAAEEEAYEASAAGAPLAAAVAEAMAAALSGGGSEDGGRMATEALQGLAAACRQAPTGQPPPWLPTSHGPVSTHSPAAPSHDPPTGEATTSTQPSPAASPPSSSPCPCLLCAVGRVLAAGSPSAAAWLRRLPPAAVADLAEVVAAALGAAPSGAAASPAVATSSATSPAPASSAKTSADAPTAAAAAVAAAARAWAAATGGRPLLALMRLYGLAAAGHAGGSTAHPPPSKPPPRQQDQQGLAASSGAGAGAACCRGSRAALAALAAVCRLAPAAVRRELSSGGPAAVGAVGAARQGDAGERLVRGLVTEARRLLERCPRGLVPRLGPDGAVASYGSDGLAPADPCPAPPPLPTLGRSASSTGVRPPPMAALPLPPPLGVVAVQALAALAGVSRRVARMVYGAGGLDLTEAAGRGLLAAPSRPTAAAAALAAAVAALHVALAAGCQTALDDICTGSDVTALGSLMSATNPTSYGIPTAAAASPAGSPASCLPPPSAVRAAERLCALVDSASPDAFSAICRDVDFSGGGGQSNNLESPLATVLVWLGLGRGHSLGLGHSHGPLTAPVVCQDQHLHGCDGVPGLEAGGGGGEASSHGREGRLAAAQLLVACLDRARRTRWILESSPGSCGGGGRGGGAGGGLRFAAGLKGSVLEALAQGSGKVARLGLAGAEALAREVIRRGGDLPPPPVAEVSAEVAAAPQVPPGPGGPPPPPASAQCTPPPAKAASPTPHGKGSNRAAGGNSATKTGTLHEITERFEGQGQGQGLGVTGEGEGGAEGGYDEDGLRTVWDSGPRPAVAAARAAWSARPLRERVAWSQSSTEVFATLQLPPGTRASEVSVSIAPDRVTVRLGWAGRVLDGAPARRVAAGDSVWALEGDSLQARGILLAKAEKGRFWRALLGGGEERGLVQVLQEAVDADERVVPVEEMDEGGRALLEELLERQALVAEGALNLETSFDDFRLVLGDSTL